MYEFKGSDLPLSITNMTLRDYFAAKAMVSNMNNWSVYMNETVARRAYEMADAMMKARNNQGEQA